MEREVPIYLLLISLQAAYYLLVAAALSGEVLVSQPQQEWKLLPLLTQWYGKISIKDLAIVLQGVRFRMCVITMPWYGNYFQGKPPVVPRGGLFQTKIYDFSIYPFSDHLKWPLITLSNPMTSSWFVLNVKIHKRNK